MKPWETAPERYDQLLADKCARTAERFAVLGAPPPVIHPSPPLAYRVRAEFRIWHDGDDLDYVMFDSAHPRVPVPIDNFPPAIDAIQRVMPPLRDRLHGSQRLRRKLFQVEFLATAAGETLVTLIYHRPLDEAWEAEARDLADDLAIHVIGRSRRQKIVLDRDYVTDRFTVGGREYRFRQYEQSFVQPNGAVNSQMLDWAWRQSEGSRGDLLELYCGNGNFTLPLASRFGKVLATEVSKVGTRAAAENIDDNGVDNVNVVRLSAEEVGEALGGARTFRRLAALPHPLDAYDLRTVFVDPPRAGLDPRTLDLVGGFDTILYISCNPDTLLVNLETLAATHQPAALAFFDQFPYTPHLECGMVLRRR